jgi:hypothetical protein
MEPRRIKVHELRTGDTFRFDPEPWYGSGVLREPVSIRYEENPADPTGPTIPVAPTRLKDIHHPGVPHGWVQKADLVKVEFDNLKVVNPPGVNYMRCDIEVVLLDRPPMTQEQWLRAFPARVVTEKPVDPLAFASDQWTVEQAKDHREQESEHGGMEVVRFEDTYYLVWSDE